MHPRLSGWLESVAHQVGLPGYWGEFGVYRGASAAVWAGVASQQGQTVHGWDTFTGLPEDWYADRVAGTMDCGGEVPVIEGCVFYKGLFQDTLPGWLKEHPGPFAFINIDCDIYSGAEFVLRALREAGRLVPGTVIHFDEWEGYPGWEEHEYKAAHEQLFPYFETEQLAKFQWHGGYIRAAFRIVSK